MLIDLMIGILAAIVIPNVIAMLNRAKEGSTKANMSTFRLSAEDYGVQNDGAYATTADIVSQGLPDAGLNFKNTFDKILGAGAAYLHVATHAASLATGSTIKGIVAYADSVSQKYVIAGLGNGACPRLKLSSGQ